MKNLPPVLIERLSHYFMTYKLIPGEESGITIDQVFGTEHALKVVEAALEDYAEEFGQ
ncbi:MAG: inorganic diphosphatase [Planctomycetota bacterium]